eukprot:7134389-Pyramimonas_sp.AAC.1
MGLGRANIVVAGSRTPAAQRGVLAPQPGLQHAHDPHGHLPDAHISKVYLHHISALGDETTVFLMEMDSQGCEDRLTAYRATNPTRTETIFVKFIGYGEL